MTRAHFESPKHRRVRDEYGVTSRVVVIGRSGDEITTRVRRIATAQEVGKHHR